MCRWGSSPFDNTKVRQVFDTTKYFSKIISICLLLHLYIECYGFRVDLPSCITMGIVLFILYLCRQ
nr:MAG TPA: YWFCY protein [Caudoviricetes sp.]